MNTTNLTIYRIPIETDAWFHFRTIGLNAEDAKLYNCDMYPSGIGSSEIGLVLGLQKKYRPCVQEVYHIKSGSLEYTQQANRAMVRGKILEPIVAQIWRLFDGTESWVNSIMDYMGGDRALKGQLSIRNCRKTSGYYVHKDFPYLFSSLDYFAEKNTPGILDGKIHPNGFPVECKTINSNYAKLWKDGVPASHICQINQEMMDTNSDYGEIACLFPDEFRFEIFPFYRDEEMCQRILKWGGEFWKKVLIGREAKQKMDVCFAQGKIEDGKYHKSIIDSNEPEPDDSEAYNEYIKDRYLETVKSTMGDIPTYNASIEYKLCGEIIKLVEQRKLGNENLIRKVLEETGALMIDFDAQGKITNNANKNGSRVLRVDTLPLINLKLKAEQEFSKLKLTL